MGKKQYPYITNQEAFIEIMNRTGIPYSAIKDVFKVYEDIVEECLANYIDIQVLNIGKISFKVKPPRLNKVYFNPAKGEFLPPKDYPGYLNPRIKFSAAFRKRLKRKTEFFDKEE